MFGLQLLSDQTPFGNQVFNVTFKSKDEENNGSEKGKYAFLAEKEWFDSDITNLSYEMPLLERVPVALEWTVSNFLNLSSSRADRQKAEWFSTSYGCRQYIYLRGYEGNPYLYTGCQGNL